MKCTILNPKGKLRKIEFKVPLQVCRAYLHNGVLSWHLFFIVLNTVCCRVKINSFQTSSMGRIRLCLSFSFALQFCNVINMLLSRAWAGKTILFVCMIVCYQIPSLSNECFRKKFAKNLVYPWDNCKKY